MDPLEAFASLDVRVGTILEAERLAGLRKAAYKLIVDFGDDVGSKQSAAQITDLYEPADLVGRQVLAVVNLPPKRMGPFISEVLVLGVPDPEHRVILIAPDRPAANGKKMF